MTDPAVRTVAALLRDHGIDYVVVGGQAVARTVPTGTMDVDIMVTTADFEETVAKLLKDPRTRLRGMREGLALLALESASGAALDVLDAAPFAGPHGGAEFYRYLVEQESSLLDGIRYATTPIVWYTRLLASRWKVYVEKILVNIGDGADPELLSKTEKIAAVFGTQAEVEPRLRYLREELRSRRSAERPRS